MCGSRKSSLLSFCVDGTRSMLVAGTRSSGKTSFLGGLMVEIMRRYRIITVEDIIEELFGEIEDEHDNIAHFEKKLEPNLFEFSARLEVDYINQNYGISLPENEFYETLGGLIVYLKEEIPPKGTSSWGKPKLFHMKPPVIWGAI